MIANHRLTRGIWVGSECGMGGMAKNPTSCPLYVFDIWDFRLFAIPAYHFYMSLILYFN